MPGPLTLHSLAIDLVLRLYEGDVLRAISVIPCGHPVTTEVMAGFRLEVADLQDCPVLPSEQRCLDETRVMLALLGALR